MLRLNRYPGHGNPDRYTFKVEVNTSGDWLGRTYICQLYLVLGPHSPIGRDMRWQVLGKSWTPEGAHQIGERYMAKWKHLYERAQSLQTEANRRIVQKTSEPKSLSEFLEGEK